MQNAQTQTLTAVKPSGTWEGPNGLLYVIQVTLSDGQSGEVMAKSPDRWSVGDEVEITDRKETQYGVKFKLSRPGLQQGFGGGSPSSNRRGPEIEAQWALNAAIQYLQLRSDITQPVNTKQVQQVAEDLLAVRDDIISKR